MTNLISKPNSEDTFLEQAESDLLLDEEKILATRKQAEKEVSYDHAEVWRILEV